MFKRFLKRTAGCCLALPILATPAGAAELTSMETRWLQAAAPVLAYARGLDLPIDIVVQPQAGPNDVPMAMGFAAKRCKLVLSMRGGIDAEAILAGLPPGQQDLMIETMAAHEIAHCWRYAQGVWHALPAGFVDVESAAPDGAPPPLAEMARAVREMREMRREEGYSDLVALAWVASRHPQHYRAVHTWLQGVRTAQAIPGGGHDTLAWVRLAADAGSFEARPVVFEAVDRLWSAGLLQVR